MGSKKRQPAPPPVPNARNIAQTDVDFNRIDQFTPFGQLVFDGPNRNRATLDFSPELTDLFNLQTQSDTNLLQSAIGAQGGIDDLIQNPLSTEGLPDLQFNLPDANQVRAEAEQNFFDRSSGLLNRQFDRNENRLRDTLANQGIQTDSAAGSQEFGDFNIQRNEAFGRLANDAVLFGGQEASRQQGLDINAQNQNNAARSTLFNENAFTRGNQFNELGALLGLQQVQTPGLNNFFGPAQANVADAFGLQQSALQNNFNNQSANARAAKGGTAGLLGTLGAGALGAGAFAGPLANGFFGQQKGRG